MAASPASPGEPAPATRVEDGGGRDRDAPARPTDPPRPGGAPGALTVQLCVALLCLIWGSTWVVIQEGLEELPPLGSAGIRFGIAAATMLVIAPALARREGGARPPAWLWATLGTTNFALSYAAVYVAETALPSGLVSVLWAVFPLVMAVAAHLFLGEHLRARHWAGFGLGFAGVVALFFTDLQQLGPDAIPMALLLLTSPVVTAVGTTLVKKYGGGTSSVLLNRNAMLVGAFWLGLAAVLLEDGSYAFGGRAWFSLLYLSLVATVTAFGLLFWLLRHAAASRLSLIAFVTPVIALLLGAAVRGEALTPTAVLGSALVIAGVAIATRRR